MYSRRKFIRHAGASALLVPASIMLAGCVRSPVSVRPSAPEPEPGDWSRLEDALRGKVIRPGDPMYVALGLARNLAYSHIRPQGIAMCADKHDVQTAVDWARDQEIAPVPRSPVGHSYAGYSATTGLSIDLSRMAGIRVEDLRTAEGHGIASLGAGGLLGPIANELWRDGLMLPAGQCATVGISGLLLAGGIGFNARRFGMTCDQLVQAEVVTANGDLVTCDAQTRPDLFWALRGGGGGTFGICTSYKVRVYDVSKEPVSVFRLRWQGREKIEKAFAGMQAVADKVDKAGKFSMLATLSNVGGGQPSFRAQGQFYGPKEELAKLLTAFPKRQSRDEQFGSSNYIDATRFLAELGAPNAFLTKSAFYDNPLEPKAIGMLVEWMGALPKSARNGSTTFFTYGGKITDGAPDTAFVHRKGTFLREGCVSWYPGSSGETVAAARNWLQKGFDDIRGNGSAFSNFIDRTQKNWQTAYYGKNFPRLVNVKTKYDPGDLFNFEQSIPTHPGYLG